LSRIAIHCCFLLLLGANVASVQAQDVGSYGKAPEMPRTGLPEALRTVGFDQNIGDPLPLDAHFLDENGQSVTLADYFGQKPVILSLVYYECPMLCSMVLNGLVRSLRVLKFDVGDEFNMITLSIDPGEGPELAHEKHKGYVKLYKRPGAGDGWHFLTGDQSQIQRVADAAGFRYAYDADTDEYAHAAGIVVLTPDGTIARYFYGMDYPPRDLRLGLVEAADGKVGNVIDQALLFCYRYDPLAGTYSAVVINILKIAAVVTLVALAVMFYFLRRRVQPVALTSRVA
jgi:protein SCO1/2